jgi:hypothetical protein
VRRELIEAVEMGGDKQQVAMSSYMRMEQRIPADQPIRLARGDGARTAAAMNGAFSAMDSERDRLSISPERLLPFRFTACRTARQHRR